MALLSKFRRRPTFFARPAACFRLAAAAASGLLLAAAFPPLERSFLAWFALVPLGAAVRGEDLRSAARLGFLSGAVFWLFTLPWLSKVTVVGYSLLALYCALYFVPPALFAARWPRNPAGPIWLSNLGLMIGWSALWTACEFVRGSLFTGFPWNPLGVSQYRNTVLIQSAAWGGVWTVSALVAWVNAAAIATLERYRAAARAAPGARRLQPHPELMLAFFAVAGAFLHGYRAILALPAPNASIRVALIQPAIPQNVKWDEAFVETVYERLRAHTELALKAARPELAIWPETAAPDDLRRSETAYRLVHELTSGGTPLLVGALDAAVDDAGRPTYFNSAFLIGRNGAILETYDKQHLVLFGEYIPFGDRFPILRRLTPVAVDVAPGRSATVFRGVRADAPFAALICFEDVFPYLARRFARAGARWFVNQTNDAWYDFSSGSRQHLANAVFRCVETRRPMARAANTGITAWIDVAGRLRAEIPNYTPDGGLAAGFLGAEVLLPPVDAPPTPYVRHGEAFAAAACATAAVFLLWALRRAAGSLEWRP